MIQFLCTLMVVLGPWAFQGQESAVHTTSDGIRFRVETVLENLEIPWSIAFDSAANMYFTERPGRLSVLMKGQKEPTLIAEISEVRAQGEGGLLGLALHPDFEHNRLLYLSYTYEAAKGLGNRVVRYRLDRTRLQDRTVIVSYIPGAYIHDGCRIKFGPDSKLYITTGDAAQRSRAQDPSVLSGKILRVNDDGSIPPDNPDPTSPVFVIGVRNPQGIDWHPTSGLMYETEHGPSGFDGPGGGDEVNLIEKGGNYGWPIIHHDEKQQGLISPLVSYTPALAPSGAAFYHGKVFPGFANDFFFGCLRGERIQRLRFDEHDPRRIVSEEALLQGEYQRIREIAIGPDGYLYFSTSNRDGRAEPRKGDDRILRMVPAAR